MECFLNSVPMTMHTIPKRIIAVIERTSRAGEMRACRLFEGPAKKKRETQINNFLVSIFNS